MTRASPSNTFAPGAVIAGKYRVERVLGQGGMGVVVEATHLLLGQRVAVKLLRTEASQSPDTVARFLREAQAAAQLPPEHIVRVSDVAQTEHGEPYLVMELLSGRDLAGELDARGPLPIVEAVDIILQACEGVAEAHAAGLIHRDLKPANLFLAARRGNTPVVKVLDFGLSKSMNREGHHDLTQTTESFGTPAYMSPEQVHSAKYAEARSDQHALAMILYELLTGKPPYDAESLTGLAVVIATAPPPSARLLRPDVPEPLDKAIQRALAKRKEDRFLDLAGLAMAIAPFGSPQAKESASRVVSALAPRSPTTVPIPVSIPPSDDKLITQHRTTYSPTISDSQRAARSKRTFLLAMIAGAVTMAAIAFAILHSGPSTQTQLDPSALATDTSVSVQIPPEITLNPTETTQPTATSLPSSEPSIQPSIEPAPSIQPTISPSVAETSSPATVFGRRPRKPPKTTPKATSSPTATTEPQTPREVFGGQGK